MTNWNGDRKVILRHELFGIKLWLFTIRWQCDWNFIIQMAFSPSVEYIYIYDIYINGKITVSGGYLRWAPTVFRWNVAPSLRVASWLICLCRSRGTISSSTSPSPLINLCVNKEKKCAPVNKCIPYRANPSYSGRWAIFAHQFQNHEVTRLFRYLKRALLSIFVIWQHNTWFVLCLDPQHAWFYSGGDRIRLWFLGIWLDSLDLHKIQMWNFSDFSSLVNRQHKQMNNDAHQSMVHRIHHRRHPRPDSLSSLLLC